MGKDLQGLPKALIPIGSRPIIWHIMKYYAYFGFNEFILCLGYKGKDIIRYFKKEKEFKITFLDTGIEANTGERLKKAGKFIKADTFFTTYGDGLSNLNLKALVRFYLRHKKLATLTAVRPHSSFGIVGIDSRTNLITHFDEKPLLDHWINGGFFIFNKGIFKYIKNKDMLEHDTFGRLVQNGQLCAYRYSGFWECMDTYKDNLKLNELWGKHKAPWSLWEK